MPEDRLTGIRLLLDASGPETVAGLVEDGNWLARRSHEGEFLEWFQPAVAGLLEETGLSLEQLEGVIYGAGPGSTLGLRLAAMFIRSLMILPSLSHWQCHSYQSLEVALAAGRLDPKQGGWVEAVAPWRRDRLHHCRLTGFGPLRFSNGQLPASRAGGLHGFILGKRPRNALAGIHWHEPPWSEIPEILDHFPELLTPTPAPAPYQAESPDFARWTAERHSGK